MKHLIAIILFACISFIPADKVSTRFNAPAGYRQVATTPGSFGAYLQNLQLLPAGTRTKTYTGDVARTDPYTAAVIDMSIGSQDLQQCADAVMRLRAEYLFQRQDYRSISFNFTSGFKCDFEHYANGYRYSNNRWVQKAKKDYSYASFMRYMTLVFSYAGTLSLEKELKPVANADELKAGDVLSVAVRRGTALLFWMLPRTRPIKKYSCWRKALCPRKTYRYCKTIPHGSPSAKHQTSLTVNWWIKSI
jgi:hypothetical protein